MSAHLKAGAIEMTIGPEARRMASGRLTVVAVLEVAVGFVAAVIGTGPLVTPSGAAERALGAIAIVLGAALIAGGTSLLIRRGPARALGMAGGGAMVLVGGLVAALAGASTGECAAVERDTTASCYGLIFAIGISGFVIGVVGVVSVAVIARAHPAAMRPRRKRAAPPRD